MLTELVNFILNDVEIIFTDSKVHIKHYETFYLKYFVKKSISGNLIGLLLAPNGKGEWLITPQTIGLDEIHGKNKIKHNWTRAENFDIWFFIDAILDIKFRFTCGESNLY